MGRRLLLWLVMSVQVVLISTAVVVGGGGRPPAMYVFGSSILDVGNNNYLLGPAVDRANHPHNGIDFPASIPTGRFSNGYNIADYVAKSMGFACSPPAYLSLAPTTTSSGPLVQAGLSHGVNYASGGAGILDSTNAGNTVPLSKQVHYFGATKAKMVAAAGTHAVDALLSRSIFLLGVGNNDMYVFAAADLARNRSAADQRRDAAVLYSNLARLQLLCHRNGAVARSQLPLEAILEVQISQNTRGEVLVFIFWKKVNKKGDDGEGILDV